MNIPKHAYPEYNLIKDCAKEELMCILESVNNHYLNLKINLIPNVLSF